MTFSTDVFTARGLLDQAPIGIMAVREGRILAVNRCLAEWLGHPPEFLIGLTAETADLLGVSLLFEDYETLVLSRNEGELQLHRQRTELPEGGEVYFFQDCTRQAQLERERNNLQEKIRSLDPRDPETGLLNREAILQALENQVIRSRRYGNPLTVMKLTLKPPEDGSLPISLKSFAQELDAELRWSDQIGRSGPSSFLLILPETLRVGAETLAAKLGHDRVPIAGTEGWALEVAVYSWQGGDDARKLLQELDLLSTEKS